MRHVFFEEELFLLIPALLGSVPSLLFSIGTFILGALAVYTIARRRGLNNAWLAWVPVVNCWILGSLSDQYQYVVKGRNRSKRKLLLVLKVLNAVFALTVAVLAMVTAASIIFSRTDAEMMRAINGPVLAILGMCLPLVCVSIAYAVIRFMVLYDVYRSLDPGNAVLFLVLSIFFGVVEPFFLFFSRNKDDGMPPRKRPEPAQAPQEEPNWQPDHQQEAWEEAPKDYL